MDIQRVYSIVRKAIDDYNLIDNGDRIAIGVSGGKDSITLLYALSGLRKFYPEHFEIEAICIDLNLPGFDEKNIREICSTLNIRFTVVKTSISDIVFKARQEKNPCSLCSKLRKGALINEALNHNCNKIAFAHHKDDVIETMLMSMIYEGRFHTFSPLTFMPDNNISVIRPMIYMNEADVKGFINKYNINIPDKICPNDGLSKREYIKDLLRKINIENPGVKERMMNAIISDGIDGWSK